MQQSQFNVIKCKGNETWVFNTLTSAFIKIDTQTWEEGVSKLSYSKKITKP